MLQQYTIIRHGILSTHQHTSHSLRKNDSGATRNVECKQKGDRDMCSLHQTSATPIRVLSGDFILGGKRGEKGHNSTVGAFATSQLLTPIHHNVPGVLLKIGQYLCNYH